MFDGTRGVIGNARLPLQALRPKVSGRTSGAGRTAGEVAADVRAARDQALARNRQVMNSDETPISLYRVYGDLMQGRDLKNSFVTHEFGNTRDQWSTVFDMLIPRGFLVLQPGLRWSSSFPMAFPGSLLVAAAPVRPGVCGLVVRWPGPDQMPHQAAHLGHGERQQIGFEIDHAFFPRPRRSGARRDRHAPASPA